MSNQLKRVLEIVKSIEDEKAKEETAKKIIRLICESENFSYDYLRDRCIINFVFAFNDGCCTVQEIAEYYLLLEFEDRGDYIND